LGAGAATSSVDDFEYRSFWRVSAAGAPPRSLEAGPEDEEERRRRTRWWEVEDGAGSHARGSIDSALLTEGI
jgi:hypothetical protein